MLARQLGYQHKAVAKALDPATLRPRILLADALGLGKTLEIGMILAELIRPGRGERILVVTPRHVLEQMQHELWSRFAIPFVRLDSQGVARVKQTIEGAQTRIRADYWAGDGVELRGSAISRRPHGNVVQARLGSWINAMVEAGLTHRLSAKGRHKLAMGNFQTLRSLQE